MHLEHLRWLGSPHKYVQLSLRKWKFDHLLYNEKAVLRPGLLVDSRVCRTIQKYKNCKHKLKNWKFSESMSLTGENTCILWRVFFRNHFLRPNQVWWSDNSFFRFIVCEVDFRVVIGTITFASGVSVFSSPDMFSALCFPPALVITTSDITKAALIILFSNSAIRWWSV